MKRVSLVLTLAVAAGLSVQAASAQTLKTVKDRGMVSCGVGPGLPGFSSPDDKGNWTGLDVDVCRGIAAAIFNDPSKVKFVPLSAKDRFTALQSGEIDVLSRTTTWTLSRDTSLGGNLQRSKQGQVRTVVGQGPLHGAAVRRNRRAVAHHHLDAVPRYVARRQSSTIQARSSSYRCRPRTASRRCSPAKSTCCRAPPPGRCRAIRRSAP